MLEFVAAPSKAVEASFGYAERPAEGFKLEGKIASLPNDQRMPRFNPHDQQTDSCGDTSDETSNHGGHEPQGHQTGVPAELTRATGHRHTTEPRKVAGG